jgi:hypothetical protein
LLIEQNAQIQDESKGHREGKSKRDSLEKIDKIRHKYDHNGHFLILFEW